MRFTTPKEQLLNAIQIAERVVGKKESLPVLSCILLEVDKGLTARATNLEAGVEVAVVGEVAEKGVVAVSASVLSQTIRSMMGDKVTLSVEGSNLLVEARGSKTLIKAVPHDEFPALSPRSEGQVLTVSNEKMRTALQSVLYAASTSMIRPELGSVYLTMSDGTLRAVATDSFRLAEKVITGMEGSNIEVLIPLKHVQELSHILERISGDAIEMVVDDAQLTVSGNGVRFMSRIVDGNFPNYKEIIPTRFTSEATLLKADFNEALRKARVFAGADQHVGFHIYPKKKVFDITAQSAVIGEMSDTLEAAVSGDDLDINFHISYVADCLQSIPSDSLVLGFSGPGKPLVIRGVSDASFTYLVMPLNR